MELHLGEERVAMRGSGAGRAGRPARRAASGRVCQERGCATRLSVYNRATRCWQHEPPRKFIPVRGGRRTPPPPAPDALGVLDDQPG